MLQHQHQLYHVFIVIYLHPPVPDTQVTQVQHLETAAKIVLLIVLINSIIVLYFVLLKYTALDYTNELRSIILPSLIIRFCSAFDSLLCNGTVQKPVTGITAIKAKHQKVGLQEAEAIDLGGDDGIDAKLTEEGQWP